MTEKIKKTEARYALDPVAFAKALILAPLIVAAFGFWALLMPVFAVLFGGLPYLVLGTPILMIYLYFAEGTPGGAAKIALSTVAVIVLAFWVYGLFFDVHRYDDGLVIWAGFSLIFAPLWGFAFGKLYNRWRSPMSRRPLPPLA